MSTYRETLRELAYDSHGLVTLEAAREAGVPSVEVHKLASRGRLHRLGKGVYRVVDAPHGRLDEFAEAVAVVGPDAYLADASVLAAADLAPVNLRRITVATPQAPRHRIPDTVEVLTRTDEPRTSIDGIPAMALGAAIRRSRPTIRRDRLIEAIRLAEARGLLGAGEADQLLTELNPG